MVYAGGDGILTTLAIVSGAYGGNLSSGVVLIVGISNCIADALNMGLGDLISGITEAEHFEREKRIFQDEVRRHPEDEMDNLRQIFVEKGMSIPDAHDLVDMIASNQNLFIEVLMNQELGLKPSDKCGASRESFVTFMSFLCFSFIPLLSYLIFPSIFSAHIGHDHMFAFSLIITLIGVFFLGFLKGIYSRARSIWTGFEMLIQGATISFISYLMGRFASSIYHVIN